VDAFIDGRGVRPPVEDDQRARVEIEAAQVTAELAEPLGERSGRPLRYTFSSTACRWTARRPCSSP
jgi:hypothetical protein